MVTLCVCGGALYCRARGLGAGMPPRFACVPALPRPPEFFLAVYTGMMRLLAVPVLLVLSAGATVGSQVHAGTMVVPDFDEVSLLSAS